jgi:hypothetical protein
VLKGALRAPLLMTYEAFSRECKWMSEPKGGFVAIADERRFEEHLKEFCETFGLQPTGGISVTPVGIHLVITQVCIPLQPGYKPDAVQIGPSLQARKL